MSQGLTLHEMVQATLRRSQAEADWEMNQIKTASAEPTHSKPAESKPTEREDVSHQMALKLAEALEYIGHNFQGIVGFNKLGEMPTTAPGVGPGEGAGTLELGGGTGGVQSENTGQATPEKVPPMNPPVEGESSTTAPVQNALKDNIEMAHPEQSENPLGQTDGKMSGMGKGAGAKEKAMSVLHRLGEAATAQRVRGAREGLKNLRNPARIKGVPFFQQPAAEKATQEAARHLKWEGAKGLAETGALYGGGGTAAVLGVKSLTKDKNKSKEASARVYRILSKLAEDALNPASISAGSATAGAPPPPGASASEEAVPSEAGEVEKQQNKMVGSNEGAIDYTKADAKAVPKSRMGEVLDEPAQKKSHDPVLQENLDAASSAGVKMSSARTKVAQAAARALLSKIAEEGCSCEKEGLEKGTCKYCKMTAAMDQKEEKQSMMGGAGSSLIGGGF